MEPDRPTGLRPIRPWWPLVAVCLSTFMLLLDVTIVNVALPSVATSLKTSFADLQWVVDGYALALAALLMLAGSLADELGHERAHLIGLAVFCGSSLVCGLAPTAGVLVAARLAQGAGGAAMFATTGALIVATYSGTRRATAFAVWGAVNGLAAAAGPVLGGLLTGAFGWSAVFWVNLPVGALAAVLVLRTVRAPAPERGARIDVAGATTFTLAVAALIDGLIAAGSAGWAAPHALAALVLAGGALVAFVVVEVRVAEPLLDLRLFRRPELVAFVVGAAVLSGAAFAHLTLVSLWMQSVLGLAPLTAGLFMMPLALTSVATSIVLGRRLARLRPALPVAGGLALLGIGVLLLTVVDEGSSALAVVAGLLVSGIGVGAATPTLLAATLAALPPERAGTAGGLVNTARQLGLAVGLALLGSVFAGRVGDVAGALAPAVVDGRAGAVVAARPEVAGLVREAVAAGLDQVFLAAGFTALGGAALILVVVRRRDGASRAQEPAAVAAGDDSTREDAARDPDAP